MASKEEFSQKLLENEKAIRSVAGGMSRMFGVEMTFDDACNRLVSLYNKQDPAAGMLYVVLRFEKDPNIKQEFISKVLLYACVDLSDGGSDSDKPIKAPAILEAGFINTAKMKNSGPIAELMRTSYNELKKQVDAVTGTLLLFSLYAPDLKSHVCSNGMRLSYSPVPLVAKLDVPSEKITQEIETIVNIANATCPYSLHNMQALRYAFDGECVSIDVDKDTYKRIKHIRDRAKTGTHGLNQ